MKTPFGTDLSDPFGSAPHFELDLEKWAAPQEKPKAKVPPGYEDSVADSVSCSQCQNFNLTIGQAWKGKGRCSKFKTEVGGQKTCDVHEPQ